MLNDDINRFLGVLAYPFVSLDFLHRDLLEEYLQIDNPYLKDKQKIRNQVVQYIRQLYTVSSYDEIYLYLDKWYLYPRYDKTGKQITKNCFSTIFDHLERLSKSLISQRDGQIVFKYWENKDDKDLLAGFSGTSKIYLFHSINRLFPLDILSIIYMVTNKKKQYELDGYYGNIQVSDALLDQVLEQGVAENHLHSGVSGSFLTMWDDLMQPLTPKRVQVLKGLNLSNTYGLDDIILKFYLCLAGLLRATILIGVKCGTNSKHNLICKKARYLSSYFSKKNGWGEKYNSLCGDVKDFSSIAEFFLNEWNYFLDAGLVDEYSQKEFVRSVSNTSTSVHTSEENLFLFEVISFLLEKSKENTESKENNIIIQTLFLNYLRIKNFFYGLMVQQKTVNGLDFFQKQYYHNNSQANRVAERLADSQKWERAIREQLQNKDLKKLELRTSIDQNETTFKKEILKFLNAYRNILRESYCVQKNNDNGQKKFKPIKSFPKVGLVFHLLKSEQEYLPEKCMPVGINDATYLQFGQLHDTYEKQIDILNRMRKEFETTDLSKSKIVLLDRYLVGIDVASLENTVPTWVFATIFEKARDSQVEPLKNAVRSQTVQSLGFTFHAGEDFRHILSGLRRIDEVARYLKFHAGDRIGHGIALGISPEVWHKSNATVIIPRIEALENYLWAYHMLSQECSDSSLVNLAYLEKRIYELSKEIYENVKGLTTNILVDGYISLFHEDVYGNLKHLLCNHCGRTGKSQGNNNRVFLPELCTSYQDDKFSSFVWDVESLLIARHCKKFVYKINEPIHYKVTNQDIDISSEVQRIVKQNINRLGIIIEVNPSSNVAIGNIDNLSEHQIYSINNYNCDMDNVIVCINSDDPSVFNTNVSNELAYIYFGMLDKGVSRESTLQWIDKLRKNGMNASFIRGKESDEQILDGLDFLLDNM